MLGEITEERAPHRGTECADEALGRPRAPRQQIGTPDTRMPIDWPWAHAFVRALDLLRSPASGPGVSPPPAGGAPQTIARER